jgi:hypothetical protein
MREKFCALESATPFIMLAVLIDKAAIEVIITVLHTSVGSFVSTQFR